MYKSKKVFPLPIKNFNPNNPIHARMMENVRAINYSKVYTKIKPAILLSENKTLKKNYQEVEEQLVI